MLKQIGKPADHPSKTLVIAATDILENVVEKQRTIARLRLDGKAAP